MSGTTYDTRPGTDPVALRRPRRLGPSNTYCGPAAISAVTGCTTAEAAAVLRDITGRKAIKACWTREILTALRRLGWHATLVSHEIERPTIARYIREGRHEDVRAQIILMTGHFIAVSGCWWTDNSPGRGVKHVNDLPWSRRRVREVITIWRKNAS
jgi:hypothetical protein